MKKYHCKKESKDSRFLAVFRKSFNKDRLNNSFSIEEAANELGMSKSTFDAKMKPSSPDHDITVTDWNHHLELSGDFLTLEYFASKHGFSIQKLEVIDTNKNASEINNQADKAMIEFNEAWKEAKESLADEILTNREIIKATNEIDDAIKEMQQLKQDLTFKLSKD